jgi:hypothetical protein
MIAPPRSLAVASFPIAALLAAAGSASAQQVLLSEVRADASGRWVELHNRSAQAVDLSSWSLHHATRTPTMPQGYWWPFPAGTVLAPDAYLRVHWFQQGTNVPNASELWTGTSPYGFLFGLGGEPLAGVRGALGLFRSQSNALMNSASVVEDWVSWGESGYQREPLAVAAGVWTAGRAAPAIAGGTSLARDPGAVGIVAHADLAWFVDFTPTPLGANVTGAVAQAYGDACALPGHHLLGVPSLRATELPLLGSPTFALAVDHTTGLYGEYVLVVWTTAAAPAATPSLFAPFAGIHCRQAIDVGQLLATQLLPAQILSTAAPLPLATAPPAAVGFELHAQALVFELLPTAWPPFQGVSNALRLVVGQ